MRSSLGFFVPVLALVLVACEASQTTPSPGAGGSGGKGAAGSGGGGSEAGVGDGGGGLPADGGGGRADGSVANGGSGGGLPASNDAAAAGGDADAGGGKLFTGPFTCTEMMGLLTTGEWYNAGFEAGLGAELGARWQGRFAHYGYVMEYAKADSYVWSPTSVGGVNNVNLTAPCTQNASAPDRVVYQAWSWELTTEEAWITNLEAAVAMIKMKRPGVRRIDLMTIVRCPMNGWCHPDKPPLGPGTDRNAGKQDCHVPDFVDAAFAAVAVRHPDLVSVAPRFEAHACAANIDGIHLGGGNGPVAADIAAHYKTMP